MGWPCTKKQYEALKSGGKCVFDQQTAPAGNDQASRSSAFLTVGSDHDAHGCIPSAGFSWCSALAKCIRPWEHDVHSTTEFTSLCSTNLGGKTLVGHDRDEHGCIPSAGYSY